MNTTVYNEQLTLKDKTINFRKWKVKDRRKFIKLLREENLDMINLTDSLVYDCLEDKNTILTQEEYRYIMVQIRIASVGDGIDFNFKCENVDCMKDYDVNLELSKILKPVYKDVNIIKVKKLTIELGFIPNKDFYQSKIKECETEDEMYLVNFLLHINKIDKNDTFTYDELIDYIEELDTDILDAIFEEWDNIRFKIDDIYEVECPHCNNKEKYQFDDMPNFFPKTWFK